MSHRGTSAFQTILRYACGRPDHHREDPNQPCLLAEVRARLQAGQSFSLATLNLDHLVKLHAFASYRQVFAAQDLIVADGNPIVWLSHLARRPVALVPRSDLLRPLLLT